MAENTEELVDPDEVLRRAERALALLNDETFKAAVKAVDAETIAAWKLAVDPAVREHLWQRNRAQEQLRSKLQSWVDQGVMVRRRIDAR